jgi:L-asparaginase/Glu-tRNA(Gln) amidotransferase subunit D
MLSAQKARVLLLLALMDGLNREQLAALIQVTIA